MILGDIDEDEVWYIKVMMLMVATTLMITLATLAATATPTTLTIMTVIQKRWYYLIASLNV